MRSSFLDLGKMIFEKIPYMIAGDYQKIPIFIGGYLLNGEAAFLADIFHRIVGLDLKNLPDGIFTAPTGVDIFRCNFKFFHYHTSKIFISLPLR